MKAGILGLSLSGKSTLFQLLTGAPRAAPGARPEPRVGVARVPDPRVDRLAEIFKPRKRTLATVEYVDVPGVAKGEGGGLVDLPALRGVDVLVHVVRAFESDTAPHPDGSTDPRRDADVLELELILADLGTVERRIERLGANIKKAKKPDDVAECALLERLKEALEAERPLREVGLTEDEAHRLRGYALLSGKPMLVVANLAEAEIRDAAACLERTGLAQFARRPNVALCAVSAPIEAEMSALSPEDARAFRDDLSLSEPGLERVIRSTYGLLGLVSFLTVGEDECRAWTVRRGTRAPEAAGVVHSDMERGFIRAQVVGYDHLVAAGSIAACRERGTLRLEGRDYEVKDGDVIEFKFNV
jgi:GTP-binding protein YchF